MNALFSSERLLFREFTIHDAALIFELNSDPEVTKFVHELPTTMEIAADTIENNILQQYKKYGYGRWAVYLKTTDEFIGWCGLKFRPELNMVDIGYRFQRRFWGKGYATEAASRCIKYAFEELALTELFAAAHIENHASLNVLKKLGMLCTGTSVVDNSPVKTFRILKEI